MNQFILKDIDISILSLLYLRDVFNLTLTNKYFKLLCDEVLHDKITASKNSAENIINIEVDTVVELKPSKKHTIDIYQHLILLTIKDGQYNLLKNFCMCVVDDIFLDINGTKYHLAIWFNDITANFDINTIRNFLRHAFYDGLIIK